MHLGHIFLKEELMMMMLMLMLMLMRSKRRKTVIIAVSAMVTGFYSTSRKSQDDTCLILYVLPLSLLVARALFSAGQNSWCVKSVAKLVP